MSQRIQTPITGISTVSTYEEGATYSLVNLRSKNGALHPVAPRKVMQELSQTYDIVFVHQNNDYKNWIGVINEGNSSSVYWDILSESPRQITYTQDKINSVQQIGNTLSLISEENIFYLLYRNNDYTFLGNLPEMPIISMGASSLQTARIYFANEYGSNSVTPDNFINATKGLINRAIQELVNTYGLQLFDAHFVRYAFRLYDGTLTKHSPPILLMPPDNILSIKTVEYRFWGGTLENESSVTTKGHKLSFYYDFGLGGDYTRWEDIISSVDIFLSAPIGISNVENIRTDMPTDNHNPEQGAYFYNVIKDISAENLKAINNTGSFYLIRSIPLGRSKSFGNPDIFPTDEADISKLENLIYQDVMSDDNFTHHQYGASVSYTYNNRLHIGDIKTTFFKGFNVGYFDWSNKYNGIDSPSGSVNAVISEIEIQTGTSLQKVYSIYSIYNYASKLFTSAFLSYPDSRAKKMTIYEVTGSTWKKVLSVALEPHNMLNLAYYVNNGLNPIIGGNLSNLITNPDTSKKITLQEPNKIKVSDLSNPLRFPNVNTYQVGNGTIMAMATNAIRISEGQFGQYPLYILTTQGIYSLDVGQGEVVYSNKSAPTSYEIPTTPITTSTPFGVVFTSARGICIIRGQEVELLTPQLQEKPKALNIEFLPPMVDVIHKFIPKVFAEYLRNVDNLVYDPYENELIICDKGSDYNYVLNLYSQAFYQSTEKIDLVVGNTFPELIVIGDNKIKNYESGNIDADGNPQRVDVSFILRPLQYGMPYIKWLEKMQLFCTLYDVNPLVYISLSSMDGINFRAMSGMAPKQRGNYSTLETMRIAGNKYRDFLFGFGASLSPDSVVNYLESWVGAEYKDNLMK